MHQHQTSIDLGGTGSLFGNAEFWTVNAVETPLLGFYWRPLLGGQWLSSKQISRCHITSDIADGAVPVPLGLVPPME